MFQVYHVVEFCSRKDTCPNPSSNGATTSFTVKLNTAPEGNVVINLISSNTYEGTIPPASLTFTASDWDTAADRVAAVLKSSKSYEKVAKIKMVLFSNISTG